MVGIVTNFDLKWPFYTRKFFAFQSGVGFISSDFFSLECFVKSIIFYWIFFTFLIKFVNLYVIFIFL